ncbi:YciI family protein [Myceligenerans cantabricum]
MTTYAVTYEYADDAAGLDEHRAAHRAFLHGLNDAGVVHASGPQPPVVAADGTTTAAGALLAMESDSPQALLETLDEDPFWVQGLITARTVREWTVVVGGFAR